MARMSRLPGLLFFASGAAGLVYQVVWMRHAALHLGSTTAAAGTVVFGLFAHVSVRLFNQLKGGHLGGAHGVPDK